MVSHLIGFKEQNEGNNKKKKSNLKINVYLTQGMPGKMAVGGDAATWPICRHKLKNLLYFPRKNNFLYFATFYDKEQFNLLSYVPKN